MARAWPCCREGTPPGWREGSSSAPSVGGEAFDDHGQSAACAVRSCAPLGLGVRGRDRGRGRGRVRVRARVRGRGPRYCCRRCLGVGVGVGVGVGLDLLARLGDAAAREEVHLLEMWGDTGRYISRYREI